MEPRTVVLYFDYKSPYAYLAKDLAYALEQDTGVTLEWRPYTLDIPAALGAVETRTPLQWAKVKYAYMDVRRWANRRGMTIRGPRTIFDSVPANVGALYAMRQGALRPYHDWVFERFFRREFDVGDAEAVRALLAESGLDAAGFPAFLQGEGRAEHDRLCAEAEAAGVFGVPTFALGEELFWGHDRIPLLRERLESRPA